MALLDLPKTDSAKPHSPNLLSEPIAPRDLISVHDLAPTEILSLFNLTAMLKRRPADFRGVLSGKQMVMFFEKPSLRTRLTFEAGMDSLGGSAFFVDQTSSTRSANWSIPARRSPTFSPCRNTSAISRRFISPTWATATTWRTRCYSPELLWDRKFQSPRRNVTRRIPSS